MCDDGNCTLGSNQKKTYERRILCPNCHEYIPFDIPFGVSFHDFFHTKKERNKGKVTTTKIIPKKVICKNCGCPFKPCD